MYYVSVADEQTGEFLGGVLVNALNEDEAGALALSKVKVQHAGDVSLAGCLVPVGASFPADAIGRLVPREELLRRFGSLEHFVEGDGVLEHVETIPTQFP